MIIFDDIQVGDILKVNLKHEDIEEETYAEVVECLITTLIVKYYTVTSLLYKGTELYELEEDEHPISVECICEHYMDQETPFLKKENYFFLQEEYDSQCSDSEIEDMSDSESEDDDFIVPDEPCELPPDHRDIDRDWNEWTPQSPGARRFKETIDRIQKNVLKSVK